MPRTTRRPVPLRGLGEARDLRLLGVRQVQDAVSRGRDAGEAQVVQHFEQGGQGGLLRDGQDGLDARNGSSIHGPHLVHRVAPGFGIGRRAVAGPGQQVTALLRRLRLDGGNFRLLRRRQIQAGRQRGQRDIGGGRRARAGSPAAAGRRPPETRPAKRRTSRRRASELCEGSSAQHRADKRGQCGGASYSRPWIGSSVHFCSPLLRLMLKIIGTVCGQKMKKL